MMVKLYEPMIYLIKDKHFDEKSVGQKKLKSQLEINIR